MIHLQGIWVKFVYEGSLGQGHRSQTELENSCSCDVKLIGDNSGSMEHRAVKFAALAMADEMV